MRIYKSNNSVDTEVTEESGEDVLQALEQSFPCSMGRSPWATDIHTAACGGPHAGAQRDLLKELWPLKSHVRTGRSMSGKDQ